ncbi:MAG: hypothetical protein ACRDKU_07965 [Gaiellaceae bacterium]
MAVNRGSLATAIVGLVGALIGGAMATAGVIYSERQQSTREDRRDRRSAQGAAHLMVDEFRSAGLYLERCIQTGKLFPVPPEADVVLSLEDRRLMARHLEPDEYGRASEAASNTNFSLRALRVADRRLAPYPLLNIHTEAVIRATLTELAEGREALRPLTGESPAVTPKPPLRRPQPGLGPQPDDGG